MRLAVWSTLGVALCLVLGAGVFFELGHAGGVAIGGAIAAANLVFITRIVRGFLAPGPAAPWVLLGFFKFALVAFAFLLVAKLGVSWMALAIGYGALPIGIFISQLAQGVGPSSARI